MRLDIFRVLALSPSSPSTHEVVAVLSRIRELRTRLHGLMLASTRFSVPDGFEISPPSDLSGEQQASSIETDMLARYRGELVVLLRSSLHLYLLPSLSTRLSYGSPPHSTGRELFELTSLACEYVELVAESIRSHLQNWNAGDPHRTQRLLLQDRIETSSCYHAEGWLSHRSAYTGCLLLLGASHAKSRAFQNDSGFSHCLGLVLPKDWRDIIIQVARFLLAHDKRSAFWHYGQQLQRLDAESRKSENNPG